MEVIVMSYPISKIQKRKQAAPAFRAVLVSGFFDTIEHSRKCFQLTMKNGEIVRGQVDESAIELEQLRRFWGQQVTVKGILHFKTSGKPSFLEAQVITTRQDGDELFESINAPQSSSQILAQVKTKLAERNAGAEIWGKWPGEENIDQLLDALKASETGNASQYRSALDCHQWGTSLARAAVELGREKATRSQ
jgi:hypothetical protein